MDVFEIDELSNKIKQNNSNYLLVSGSSTDWNFINRKQLGLYKNSINKTENYRATYNDGFLTFLQEDIGFNSFPPLKDKFGEVNISKEYQKLKEDALFQQQVGELRFQIQSY